MKVKVKFTAVDCETGPKKASERFVIDARFQEIALDFLGSLETSEGSPEAWRDIAKRLETMAERFIPF